MLLDCKRADVPNTMAAYASAVFEAMEFDAATVHAYHGADSLPSRGTGPEASTSFVTRLIPDEPICSIYVVARIRCLWPWLTWRRGATRKGIREL